MFRVQLDWLEVVDVVRVEEHVSNSCGLLVNFEWVTCEGDSLGDDPSRIWVQEATHGHKMWGL